MDEQQPAASKIPVILCIDVEPDPFSINRADPEPWDGYAGTREYLARMRERFERRTGAPVHYNWFFRMDPQVAECYGSPGYIVERHPGFIEEFQRAGDGFGAHTHVFRWDADSQGWLEDMADPHWAAHCVRSSLAAHREVFGGKCGAFRLGTFWMNTATINLLESLGVRYDLTVEPGLSPTRMRQAAMSVMKGELPDYCRAPRVPYAPSRSDFLKPTAADRRALRIVPLSAASLDLGNRYLARLRRLYENGIRHRLQDTPLSMWRSWEAPDTFGQMIDRALAAQKTPYLALTIRSSIGTGRSFANVDRCLNALLEHPQAERFVLTTPDEAMDIIRRSAS